MRKQKKAAWVCWYNSSGLNRKQEKRSVNNKIYVTCTVPSMQVDFFLITYRLAVLKNSNRPNILVIATQSQIVASEYIQRIKAIQNTHLHVKKEHTDIHKLLQTGNIYLVVSLSLALLSRLFVTEDQSLINLEYFRVRDNLFVYNIHQYSIHCLSFNIPSFYSIRTTHNFSTKSLVSSPPPLCGPSSLQHFSVSFSLAHFSHWSTIQCLYMYKISHSPIK